MRYWWVNQNQTYRHEIAGGYLWSPKRNANKARNPFYESMREVSPGDIIFSFRDTRIATLGIARSYCYRPTRNILRSRRRLHKAACYLRKGHQLLSKWLVTDSALLNPHPSRATDRKCCSRRAISRSRERNQSVDQMRYNFQPSRSRISCRIRSRSRALFQEW